MSEEDWTLVKVPNKLIEMGISMPVVPIRTNLRSEIFDEGIVKFSAILEELELFLEVQNYKQKPLMLTANLLKQLGY